MLFENGAGQRGKLKQGKDRSRCSRQPLSRTIETLAPSHRMKRHMVACKGRQMTDASCREKLLKRHVSEV